MKLEATYLKEMEILFYLFKFLDDASKECF